MTTKSPGHLLFCAGSLSLLLLASCAPIVIVVTATPLPVTNTPARPPLTDTPGSVPVSVTPSCPPEQWPCPSDSLTLTAAMGATFDAIPTNTPPPWATVIPQVGDLGWGSVYGRIIDGNTALPIAGATIRCEHFSYTSPYRCSGVAITNADGLYSFTPVFFHDTDRIMLVVEAPGYLPLRFEQSFFTRPEFHADLGLFSSETPTSNAAGPTETPWLMCTPPACSGGDLICGRAEGCPGGCGTICVTATPSPAP